MSRYKIPASVITDTRVSEIIVGWDRPLRTFFVQVHTPDPDEEGETMLLLHEGCDIDRQLSMHDLKVLLSPYASLPPEIEQAMKCDQSGSISQVDGPSQRHLKDLIRQLFDYDD